MIMDLPKWVFKIVFYFQIFLSFIWTIIIVVGLLILLYLNLNADISDSLKEIFKNTFIGEIVITSLLSGLWIVYFIYKFDINDKEYDFFIDFTVLLQGLLVLRDILHYSEYGLTSLLTDIYLFGITIYFFKCYDFFKGQD